MSEVMPWRFFGLLGLCSLSLIIGSMSRAQEEALLRPGTTAGQLEALRRVENEAARLGNYRFGEDRAAWNALEERMRNPNQWELIGRILSHILIEARDATIDSKILACRGLRRVARNEPDLDMGYSGIQSLLSKVRDERLSGEACLALQEKNGEGINETLREALPIVENNLKRQLVVTLGRRRDREAIPVIVELLHVVDEPAFQVLAIKALGQIGGAEVLAALDGGRFDGRYGAERETATLAGAVRSLGLGEKDRAAGFSVLLGLRNEAKRKAVRLGALYELARHDKARRWDLCEAALTSREDSLLEIAPRIFSLLEQEQLHQLYGSLFDRLSVRAKTLLVELWKPDYREENKMRALAVDLKMDPLLRGAAQRAVDRLKE